MIGLHSICGGTAGDVALSTILGLGEPRDNQHGVELRRLYFSTKTDVDLLDYQVRDLLGRPVQIMPADPALKVAWIWEEDGEPVVFDAPLIGWALTFGGQVLPMTPAGVCKDSPRGALDRWYIQSADGRYTEAGEGAAHLPYATRQELIEAYLIEKRAGTMIRGEAA